MDEDLYFEGDPASDSTRRHLERVLNEPRRRRRWPWVVGSVAAVAAWYFWPLGAPARPPKEADDSAKTPPP
jgi:hypothetical protein